MKSFISEYGEYSIAFMIGAVVLLNMNALISVLISAVEQFVESLC
jgi:hypothetical protein